MAPINLPNGNEVAEIVLPNGNTASEVIAPDGTTVFSALPDSVVWQLNAKKLSGFTDGDGVGTRPDQIGSGDVTGSATYRTDGLNGYPTVDYNGTDDDHVGSGPSLTQPFTIIAVVDADFPDGDSDDYWLLSPESGDSSSLYFSENWEIFSGSVLAGSTDADVNLLSAVFDGPDSVLREDGSQTASGDAGTNNLDLASISNLQTASGRQFDGDNPFIEAHDERLSSISDREQAVADKFDLII